MIYSRWGIPLQIVADCALVRFDGDDEGITRLVRAIRRDDGATRHYFAHTLRADGGVEEIQAAIDAAPRRAPKGRELTRAIQEAL